MTSKEQKIKAALHASGFDRVGIASADYLHDDAKHLKAWLDAGFAGEMAYMTRSAEARADTKRFLEGARSVVVAAAAYAGQASPSGPVAGYGLFQDYHSVLANALNQGVAAVQTVDATARCRISVDSSPLLERALARRAGLGWIGYSGNLVTPEYGPFVLLGLIVTTLPLAPDDQTADSPCSECGLCLKACPTGALKAPYTLDARRCVSYLTVERRGPFNNEEAASLGGWAFGCDQCTAACLNRPEAPGPKSSAGLLPLNELLENADLSRLLDLCESGFKKHFRETPLFRCGKGGMIRNILTAAKNQRLAWLPARAEAHLAGGTPGSRHAARCGRSY